MIPLINPKCPYDDKDCPKIAEMDKEIEKISTDIKTLSHYLYLIIGMIAVNWGVTLWRLRYQFIQNSLIVTVIIY